LFAFEGCGCLAVENHSYVTSAMATFPINGNPNWVVAVADC
jgi:hypothetical protein